VGTSFFCSGTVRAYGAAEAFFELTGAPIETHSESFWRGRRATGALASNSQGPSAAW
jgi:hypothetical protein